MPGASVGSVAIDRASFAPSGHTFIGQTSADTLGATFTTVKLYAAIDMTGVAVGLALFTGGNVWACYNRAEIPGTVLSGAERTYSGLSLTELGYYDYLAIYFAAGALEADVTGSGAVISNASADEIGQGEYQFTPADLELSLYATGVHGPTVTTQDATSVSYTTATGNGNVTDTGGGITERGICYKTSTGPTTADSTSHDHTDSAGAFTMPLTGLNPGTTYHCRAYAINAAGTSYGAEFDFVTTALSAPTVTTQAVTSIDKTTATGNGNVTNNGGAVITERGICYKTSTGPTTADSTSHDHTNSTGAFTMPLTGLIPDTTYHCKAYAINSVGTSYGSEVTFTTGKVPVVGGIFIL